MKLKCLFSLLIWASLELGYSQPCTFADRCDNIQMNHVLQCAPTDLLCGEFILNSIKGCITPNALPENVVSNCGHDQHPTVWIKLTTDENAVQLFTFVTTNGSWQPVWSIYSGSCDNLKLISGGTIDNPLDCSNSATPLGMHNIGIPNNTDGLPQTEFYVAISAVGVIDNPNFTISAFTQSGCASCIGNDACSSESTFKVVQRSSSRDLNDPIFETNETVKVCLDLFYDPSDTGSDWLHGLLPDFGNGWDLDLFNPENIEVEPPGAQWYSSNDVNCYPKASRNLPLACTYRDENNQLKLCNIKCGTCPCAPNLPMGSPLPSGWFWTSTGGEGCLNSCLPSSSYGLPGSNEGVNVKLCMFLTTKSKSKINNVEDLDLTIKFNTTSMGITGCWNDPLADCSLDVTQIGPKWVINPALTDTCFVTVYDTLVVTDTIVVTDTLFVSIFDTITTTVTEFVSVTDTLIINLNIPNSTGGPKTNRIIVYPNPASSHITLDFGNYMLMQNYSAQILNTLGQPVYFTPINQKMYYIDLNTWGGKGTYFLRIINDFGQTVETKKIILQ